jgi:hypothetical protein
MILMIMRLDFPAQLQNFLPDAVVGWGRHRLPDLWILAAVLVPNFRKEINIVIRLNEAHPTSR